MIDFCNKRNSKFLNLHLLSVIYVIKAFIFSLFFLSCNIRSHRSSLLVFAATIFKIYAQKIFSQHGPYKKKLNFAVPRTPVFSARLGTSYEMGLKRQRETKKIIFNNICKSYVRGHSFMTPAKKFKFRTPNCLFPSIHKYRTLV